MKLKAIATTAALLASLATLATPALARHDVVTRADVKAALRSRIADQRQRTWQWQDKAGTQRWPTRRLERNASLPYLYRLARLWKHRHAEARKNYRALPAHLSAWLCIHRYEGSWTDAGAPYYGGLQMDMGFQQHYGAELLRTKGTADHWTPLEQMQVAEKAYKSGRGFYPWPNTARYCGLI